MTNAAELRDLAAAIGCDIPVDRAELLLAYLDAMLAENEHINLTAIRDRETAVMLHALDSLAVGATSQGFRVGTCLDIGTGNGFPGVGVACLFPDADVLLIDRTLKKIKAIERALAAVGFDPARVRTEQLDAAEAKSRGYGKMFDLVTTRAVGTPQEMGRLAHPLLAQGGRLLCWVADDPVASSAQLSGMKRIARHDYALPAPADRKRRLLSFAR